MNIGRKIAKARRARGMTQVRLARRVRLSESAVARLETGRRTVCGERAIFRICRLLGIAAAEPKHGPGVAR